MNFKNLEIGDVILAKEVNNAGKFSPKNYDAIVVEKGRKYIYFEVQYRKIKRELIDRLPSGLKDHHTVDYFLFKDENQFAEYLLAKEARIKLEKFFNYDAGLYKLADDQVEQISKIIGI